MRLRLPEVTCVTMLNYELQSCATAPRRSQTRGQLTINRVEELKGAPADNHARRNMLPALRIQLRADFLCKLIHNALHALSRSQGTGRYLDVR